MDAATTLGSDVTRKGITFKRLSVRDYGAIEAALADERKEQTTQQVEAVGLLPAEQLATFQRAAAFPVNMADVDRSLDTGEGAIRVVRASLKKSGKSDSEIDAILDTFTMLDLSSLARDLLGFGRMDDLYVRLMERWMLLNEDTKREIVELAQKAEDKADPQKAASLSGSATTPP